MKYELKKLLSNRFFLVIILGLLCVNCVLSYIAAPSDRVRNEWLSTFFKDYEEHPEVYDELYSEYIQMREKAIENQMSAVMRGEDPEQYAFEEPQTLYPESGYNDIEFYAALYDRVSYRDNYINKLSQIITDTENNMKVVTDSYFLEYLDEVRTIYSSLQALPLSDNQVSGWDAFFSYHGTGLLLLFVVLIAAFLLATADSETGIEQVIFASKKGYRGVVFQKIFALLLFCAMTLIAFESTSFLVFCSKTSFTGAAEFLASLENYILCPFAIYIYEYEMIRLLVLFSSLFPSGVLFLLLSKTIPNTLGYLVTCVLYLGGNYLLETAKTMSAGSLLHSLNIFRMLNADSFCKQYVSVNLFGMSIPLFYAFALVGIFGSFLLGSLLLLLWKKGQSRRPFKIRLPKVRSHSSHTLFGYEIKKLFFGSKLLIPVVILVFLKVFLCSMTAQETLSYQERLYRSYMQTLEGTVTAEKEQFLEEERVYFETLFSEAEKTALKYEKGEITHAQFLTSTMELRAVEKKYEVFLEVEQEVARIKRLNENGICAQIVYGTGWEKLFFRSADLLYMLLLVISAFAYSLENRENFRPILHVAKGGRLRTFACKIAVCTVFSTICCAFFFLLDFRSISCAYSVAGYQAPAISVSALQNIGVNASLAEILALLLVKRIVLSGMLSCIAVCLSDISRNRILSPILFALGIFIPHAVSVFLGGNTKFFSIPDLFCFSQSFEGSAIPLSIMLLFCFAALLVKAIRMNRD